MFNNKRNDHASQSYTNINIFQTFFQQQKGRKKNCLMSRGLLDRTCEAVSTPLQLSVICTFNTKWQQTLAGSVCACVLAPWN